MTSENNSTEHGELVPLFPLPQTVFYPNTLLPLHIFEPRYRQMVDESLQGEKKIGMVLLLPGWEANYYAAPPIAKVGCVGQIEKHVRLEDGKYNMLLKGLNRFRIVEETEGKPYRRASIETLKEINDQSLVSGPNPLKEELLRHCYEYIRVLASEKNIRTEMNLEDCKVLSQLTDQIAYQLNLTVEQKQKLLEEQDVLLRVDSIHAMLKMKMDIVHLSKMRTNPGRDLNLN